MFQGNTVLAGVFFLLGILVNSRINGLYTILGALLPIPFALLLGVDYAALNAGLMGYNGVLCAIALGDKTWKGGVGAVMAVLLSVLLQIGGMEWGITTLTAPLLSLYGLWRDYSNWIERQRQKLQTAESYKA